MNVTSLQLREQPGPTRSTFAYRQLREWIIHGHLSGGAKLDQEQLADVLGISRTPLRQAFLQLEADGLVEHRPYQGVVVTALSVAHLNDVYATRRAVEGMLAAEAASRVEDSSLAEAEQVLEQQIRATEMGSAEVDFVELDRGFHTSLYRLSAFRNALEIVNRLLDLSERYARMYAKQAASRQRSIEEHMRILDAIGAGNAELARELTEQHIERGRLSLSDVIGRRDEEPNEGAK